MAEDIGLWLDSIGLGQYAQTFADNGIDIEDLPHLRDEDFERLGVLLGHMRRLQTVAETLSADEPPTPPSPHLSKEPEPRPADAERRQLTVMFCDLVGSTDLSARLDPEDLREVMRHYQDTVAGVVARFEGHVAKFLGDGVLAFFGWPRAYEDQAERALRAALTAINAVARLKTQDGLALEARAGIATGQVVIGDIVGEATTEKDAVAGITPNLAARLQGVASPGQVVIDATTRLLIGEAFDLEDLGTHDLKGFAAAVTAWHVVGESAAESRFEAAHPGVLSRLVGREPEFALLRRAWEQSQAGVGQVVLINGEAGIGKSRLMEALGGELKAEGCTRIMLGCSPYHTNSAFYPMIVHLKRVLGWQGEDNAEVRLAKLERALQRLSLPLDELIPLFASLLSLPLAEDRYPQLKAAPHQQKQQTLDAVVTWLLEEAERQPVLQVWEDLHWADPSTLELLALEIEQAPTAPILNVLTFRPDFTPPWPQRSHMTPLTLNRLDPPEVEAVIGQHTGGSTLPDEVVEHIVSKTDGVPLYVEELTKVILEADLLHERDGRYELTGPLSGVTIPATLQDLLMARLDRLPSIREVAQLGAVLGREFTYEMLMKIGSIEETTLQEGLEHLVDADLLYRRGRPPRARYAFKHALVQDVAYESLLKSKRRQLHGRIARVLEDEVPGSTETTPDVLAHHYTEAALPRDAIAYWLKAGGLALSRSANLEAIAHLEKGIEVAGALSPQEGTPFLIDLMINMGSALAATKGYASSEVENVYARVHSLCVESGDEQRLFPVLRGQQSIYMLRGPLSKAQHMSQELLQLADNSASQSRQTEAHRRLGWCLFCAGEMKAGHGHLLRALELYDTSQAHHHIQNYGSDPKVIALANLAWLEWFLGFPDRAMTASREAIEMARAIPHSLSEAYAMCMSAAMLQVRRDPVAAQALAAETISLATRKGFPYWEAWASIIKGWAEAQCGSVEPGLGQIEKGLLTYRATGSELFRSYSLALLAETCWAAGRADEALRHVDAALAEGLEREVGFYNPEIQRLRGEVLGVLGATREEIETCYVRAVEIARHQGSRSLELRATVSLARLGTERGEAVQIRERLSHLLAGFTEGFDTPDLKEAKALLDELI